MTKDTLKRAPGLSPEEFAGFLPSPLLLATAPTAWPSVTVQHLQYEPTSLDLPPARDHRLALHLSGATLIEGKLNRSERRWSDAGHATLIPAGTPALRELKGRPDFLLIHVPLELANEVTVEAFDIDPKSVSMVSHLAVPDATLDRLGRLLLAEAEADVPGGRLALDMLTRMLVLHMLRRFSSLSAINDPAPAALPQRRLKRVLDYMNANLAADLSLVELSAIGGLSPSQFSRAFRAAMGEPPHRYLIGLRVKQAQIELEQTTLPVIEIGLRCGFQQPSHFAASFSRITGMTPREYRTARCG